MSERAIEITSHHESDTRRLAECVAAGLDVAHAPTAIVLGLHGDLGAGKTRFVRGLAGALGVDMGAVTSPTFVLSVEHRGADGVRLVHIDAWRIRSEEDLESIGWQEMLAQPRTLVAVEWAERIERSLPESRVDVFIEHAASDERTITIVDRRSLGGARDKLLDGIRLFEPFFAVGAAQAAPAAPAATSACPTCKSPVANGVATFPFCSSRCRMADLHRWFAGGYTISRPTESDEELSE